MANAVLFVEMGMVADSRSKGELAEFMRPGNQVVYIHEGSSAQLSKLPPGMVAAGHGTQVLAYDGTSLAPVDGWSPLGPWENISKFHCHISNISRRIGIPIKENPDRPYSIIDRSLSQNEIAALRDEERAGLVRMVATSEGSAILPAGTGNDHVVSYVSRNFPGAVTIALGTGIESLPVMRQVQVRMTTRDFDPDEMPRGMKLPVNAVYPALSCDIMNIMKYTIIGSCISDLLRQAAKIGRRADVEYASMQK